MAYGDCGTIQHGKREKHQLFHAPPVAGILHGSIAKLLGTGGHLGGRGIQKFLKNDENVEK